MLVKLTRTEKSDLFDVQDEIKDLNRKTVRASLSFMSRTEKKYYSIFWLPMENVLHISVFKNNKRRIIFQKKVTRSMSELKKTCRFD